MSENHPNIVLIAVDQWRGDCLSILGHPDVRTPYLDQLAGGGAQMTQAYAACPTCVPSRMGLMTGTAPTTHRRIGYQDGITFDMPVTLPGALRDAGYQTQAIGKMHYWPERGRIGFDDVILHDGYLHYSRHRERDCRMYDDYLTWLREQEGTGAAEDYIDNGLECNSMVARPWDKAEKLHPTNWVVTEATQWLYRRDPTCPFFLYLSFHRPHAPLDPPQWAFDSYDQDELTLPGEDNWSDELMSEERRDWDPTALAAHYRERDVRLARAGYYGHMTHIDSQISRFIQTLGEFGLAENTVVAFVSDHGDMMGDHGLWRKGYPYEASSHVPFILYGAGIAPGTRVDSVVEIRDVMPTLLDVAGVEIPEEVEGRSVLPLIAEADDEVPWREYLHGEHYLFDQSIQWIRFGAYKYVWFSGWGIEQLFNLDEDPEELVDLCKLSADARSSEVSDALLRGRNYLIAELEGREEGYVADGRLVPGRESVKVLTHSYPLREEAR